MMHLYYGGSHDNGNISSMGISICIQLYNVACETVLSCDFFPFTHIGNISFK